MQSVSGGDTLLKLLQAIEKGVTNAEAVEVGWMEGNIHPDSGIPTAEIAADNEFGTPKIPARPFIKPTELKKAKVWSNSLSKELKQSAYNAELALEGVGQEIKTDIQKAILEVFSPALSPYTIEKKGFDKPLIDSSHMIDSIDTEVKK